LRFNLPLVVREHNRRPDRTIRIHDELSGKWGFINPKPEARTVDSDNEQTIHPYALKLVGKLVNYKRFEKEIPYGLPNGFSDIASGVEFLSNNFDTMLWQ
jgi:hypothetical protein